MAARIRVLSGALVDQIAAGEVVERPASVVKELVENALDAEAGSVVVETAGGGLGRIRVTDDGVGMAPGDAMLAVRRHATSKISTQDDLTAIRTLGFRGEALPSIASVSRFTLTTRSADRGHGVRVRIEGGVLAEPIEAGCAPGTIVEVDDLFFNVPARRKFLKTPATELGRIGEVCARAALSAPGLRLRVLKEGRVHREYLPASSEADRARQVFPGERLHALEGVRDGVRIRAYLAPPERARSGATHLHILVNGRPVRDRALARAVAFAHGSVLPPGRYPIGVLYLEVSPEEVDVNVHPQKAEVRFARGRAVAEAITRALADALGTTAWGRPTRDTRARADDPGAYPPSPRAPGPRPPGGHDDPWGLAAFFGGRSATSTGEGPAGVAEGPGGSDAPDRPASPTSTGTPLLGTVGFFGGLRLLGQVRRTFLVCEGADGLYVLDQHAADERIRYHRLREAYDAGPVAKQTLLFPTTVEVTATEAALVGEHGPALDALGVEVDLVGPTTAAVRAVPALLRRADPERLLRDLFGELDRSGERAFGDAVDTAIATMACHGAIRAGDPLSPDEVASLLAQLDEVPSFSGHCPHGRPVVFEIGFRALERELGR